MSLVVSGNSSSIDKKPTSKVLRLRGHKAPVLTTKFNNDSTLLASGGMDKHLAIWNLNSITEPESDFTDETELDFNYLQLHKSAITSLAWSNLQETLLFTASADATTCCFDLNKSAKTKTFRQSSSINQIAVSKKDLVLTASDSNGVKLWDLRSKFPVAEIPSKFPVLTCCIDTHNDTSLYFSGIDPTVHCYDIRNTQSPTWSESNQFHSITSLSLSRNGEYLLSKSLDGTIKYFDSRIIVKGKRAKPYLFDGPKATQEDYLIRSILVESESDDTKKTVVSGSNDGFIYSWDFLSRKLLDRIDGHTGTILDLDYSSTLGKLATSSNDTTVILRDL
ncbi:unnamed protein product [Ambrosiozyma monospora]|uniref:Unnamed protein product n=1 Tax=Ambrosiozyma monospora TaxID=43982 RepID=A0ACB5T4T3_AMBMO|nr:unnamed protein product [Ambrosiozyma monospora]